MKLSKCNFSSYIIYLSFFFLFEFFFIFFFMPIFQDSYSILKYLLKKKKDSDYLYSRMKKHGIFEPLIMQKSIFWLRDNGKYDKALDLLKKQMKYSPNYIAFYNEYGYLLIKKGKLSEAKKWFEKALQYDSFFPAALNNLGAYYAYQKNYKKALSFFRKSFLYSKKKELFTKGYFYVLSVLKRYPEMFLAAKKALSNKNFSNSNRKYILFKFLVSCFLLDRKKEFVNYYKHCEVLPFPQNKFIEMLYLYLQKDGEYNKYLQAYAKYFLNLEDFKTVMSKMKGEKS